MNLGDLLQELRYNILHDRSDQVSGTASDQLWSDATLTRYINEAEYRFARKALVIRDKYTPEVTQLFPVAGQDEYPLHPAVLSVLSARCAGDRSDLARAGHSYFDTYRVPDTYFFDPSSLSTLQPGKVVAFGTDEGYAESDAGSNGVVVFRTYPAPDASHLQQINLRVVRLPLEPMSALTDTPDLPEAHHLDMLSWAAYLALRIVDVDAGSPQRALEFKAQFEEHIEEALQVSKRKSFAPLEWGFGRNGFSWEMN